MQLDRLLNKVEYMVFINGITSFFTVNRSVPHLTLLYPILFVHFINVFLYLTIYFRTNGSTFHLSTHLNIACSFAFKICLFSFLL